MSRPVSMRPSYGNDGSYLLRLKASVLADEREPAEWRSVTADMVLKLALRLLEADSRRKGAGAARRAPARG